MRAKHLRARLATRTGTLSFTLASASLVLGSASAVALAAPSGPPRTADASAPADVARAAIRHHHRKPQRSQLLIHRDQLARPTGTTVVVHGMLEPERPGAEVRLQRLTRVRSHITRWSTLAVAHTGHDGHFGLRFRLHGSGVSWIRVHYPGNRQARAVSAAAGRIVALAPIIASWYDDAGNTACGFHATYGVANRSLPCGTKVTLAYGGRTVVATVDDRGPYVYGRTYDLNQNTARYLGMWGVGTVFASV